MKRSHWSIADLDRQQLAVGVLALRAELDRRELRAARIGLVRSVRATVGLPFALSGCFFAGVALGRASAPLGSAAQHLSRRLGTWFAFVMQALQPLALSSATAPWGRTATSARDQDPVAQFAGSPEEGRASE